jgi:hypothetical protein
MLLVFICIEVFIYTLYLLIKALKVYIRKNDFNEGTVQKKKSLIGFISIAIFNVLIVIFIIMMPYIQRNYDKYPDYLVGYAGFQLSYGGKWFGGYRRDKVGKRNYSKEAYNNTIKQIPHLKDIKFINKDFRELPLEKYQVKEYDYHQLCFIMKYSPESMLYLSDRFSSMENFDNQRVYKFYKVRYHEILKSNYNDEQLYYYYAIKLFGFNDLIMNEKDMVLKSNNQVLISYYLKDDIFSIEDIESLKNITDEKYLSTLFSKSNSISILYRIK